jgi:hypothetical protein
MCFKLSNAVLTLGDFAPCMLFPQNLTVKMSQFGGLWYRLWIVAIVQ